MEVKTTIEQEYPKNTKKKVKKSTEQFKWGKINVLDIIPDVQIDDCPVLFAPGWSITIQAIEETLTFLADHQKRVISLNHKRVGGVKKESEEHRKAFSILATLNRKEVRFVDAVGYSEGCTNVLLAAHFDPDRFRNIVLINPPGLIGKGKMWSIIRGFLIDFWGIKDCKDGARKRQNVLKESLKYIFLNPVRSYREVSEIASSDLISLIKGINGTGIKISIIHNINDKTFDFGQVNRALANAPDLHVEEFYAVGGGHFGLIKFPKKYMNIVSHALKELRKRKD